MSVRETTRENAPPTGRDGWCEYIPPLSAAHRESPLWSAAPKVKTDLSISGRPPLIDTHCNRSVRCSCALPWDSLGKASIGEVKERAPKEDVCGLVSVVTAVLFFCSLPLPFPLPLPRSLMYLGPRGALVGSRWVGDRIRFATSADG